jgi:hypothetical protein
MFRASHPVLLEDKFDRLTHMVAHKLCWIRLVIVSRRSLEHASSNQDAEPLSAHGVGSPNITLGVISNHINSVQFASCQLLLERALGQFKQICEWLAVNRAPKFPAARFLIQCLQALNKSSRCISRLMKLICEIVSSRRR